jgi:curved DNA-binding protein CbpA
MQNATATDTINWLFLEFERLASRVELSSTHYQVLGIDSDASLEEIKRAYQKSVSLIRPFYTLSSQAKETTAQERAARILKKTSAAFSVLSNIGKKVEYNNLLFRKRPGLVPVRMPVMECGCQGSVHAPGDRGSCPSLGLEKWTEPAPSPAGPTLVSLPQAMPGNLPANGFQRGSDEAKNRRRHERFKIAIPVLVIGHDRFQGRWNRPAETIDVSRTGLQMRGDLPLRHGNVVHLNLVLPTALRSYGTSDPSYSVYAIARRIGPLENGTRTIGVEFLGQHPPAGYADRPWATYRTDSWKGVERRREVREDRSEVVSIKYLNEVQRPLRQEIALTENISPGGAMIYVKAAPPEIEFIRLSDLTHSFDGTARICDRYIGNDGLERICLQFMDRKWILDKAGPPRLIRG